MVTNNTFFYMFFYLKNYCELQHSPQLSPPNLDHSSSPVVGCGDEKSASFYDEEISNDVVTVRTFTASYERATRYM